jgi:hypothetical protein
MGRSRKEFGKVGRVMGEVLCVETVDDDGTEPFEAGRE